MKHLSLLTVAVLGSLPLLSGCGHLSVDRAATTATGYVSHQLCSAVFLAGQDPDRTYHDAIEPLAGPFAFLRQHHVDREHAEVRATVAGLAESRAVYRPPYGCVNASGTDLAGTTAPPAARVAAPALLPPIAGPEPVTTASRALNLNVAANARYQPPHSPP